MAIKPELQLNEKVRIVTGRSLFVQLKADLRCNAIIQDLIAFYSCAMILDIDGSYVVKCFGGFLNSLLRGIFPTLVGIRHNLDNFNDRHINNFIVIEDVEDSHVQYCLQ